MSHGKTSDSWHYTWDGVVRVLDKMVHDSVSSLSLPEIPLNWYFKSLLTRAMKKMFKNMNYSENKVWNLLCSSWYFTHVLWCQCRYTLWIELVPQTRVKNAKQLAPLCCPFLFGKALIFVFPSPLRLAWITILSTAIFLVAVNWPSACMQILKLFYPLKEHYRRWKATLCCDFSLGFYISTHF